LQFLRQWRLFGSHHFERSSDGKFSLSDVHGMAQGVIEEEKDAEIQSLRDFGIHIMAPFQPEKERGKRDCTCIRRDVLLYA